MMEEPRENLQELARRLCPGWRSRPTKADPIALRAQMLVALFPNMEHATTPCEHCGTMPLLYHEGICPCSLPGCEEDEGWEVNMSDFDFHPDHTWFRQHGGSDPDGRVGITEHAQNEMGDVIFLQLPAVDDEVTAGEPCGTIESCKSVEDIISPVTGVVTALNDAAVNNPELVNVDPYYDGWLFTARVSDAGTDGLLSGSEYLATLEGE